MQFETTHKLPFEQAHWYREGVLMAGWFRFKVGTCTGVWRCTGTAYEILGIKNQEKGNGHLTDVLEWFIHSANRDGLQFIILEVWNEGFKKNLITKRGFKELSGTDHVIYEGV